MIALTKNFSFVRFFGFIILSFVISSCATRRLSHFNPDKFCAKNLPEPSWLRSVNNVVLDSDNESFIAIGSHEYDGNISGCAFLSERVARGRIVRQFSGIIDRALSDSIADSAIEELNKVYRKSKSRTVMFNNILHSIMISQTKKDEQWYSCEESVLYVKVSMKLEDLKKDLLHTLIKHKSRIGIEITDAKIKELVDDFISKVKVYAAQNNI